MKRKLVFLFVLFFFIFSSFIFASETDFYGLWYSEFTVYNDGYNFNINISDTVLSIDIILFSDDYEFSLGVYETQILSWTEVKNTDVNTVTTGSGNTHTHTQVTHTHSLAATESSAPTNLQPYIVVNMWERIS